MYLRLYWRFLFIPVTLDWQVKSLSIGSCNRDWLTTHRRSAKYPPSLCLSWRQFTWFSINTGIILVQQWVGLKLSQWTAYTSEVRQLMVCVNDISTFSRTKASFLSTRSCKVYYIMDCIINFDTHNQCAKKLGKIGMGFFLRLFSGKGMFLGLVGGPKDFLGSFDFAPIRSSLSLEIRSMPWSFTLWWHQFMVSI